MFIKIGFSLLVLTLFMACASTVRTPKSAQLNANTSTDEARVKVEPKKRDCDFLAEKTPPLWVNGNRQIPGYYIGVGTANIQRGQFKALELAKQNAQSDLASSININVSKSILQHTHSETNNGIEVTSHESEIMSQSITHISLRKVTSAGHWYNKETCQVTVRVKVDNAFVEKIQNQKLNEQRLERAEKHFAQADDGKQSLDKKTHNMESAMKLLDDVDFSQLPLHSRDMFHNRYKKRLTSLHDQASGHQILIYVNARSLVSEETKANLINRFIGAIKGSWARAELVCQSSGQCLQIARRERARQLLYVDASASSNDDVYSASTLGKLRLTIKLFDAFSGKMLIRPTTVTGKTLSFEPGVIDWDEAIERIFSQKALLAVTKESGI